MKRNVQIGAAGVASSLLLFAGIAYAASMTGEAMMHKDSTMPSSMMMMHPPAPMILTVNNEGMGRLRGVVTAVNATSLSVAAWGGVWTINTGSDTLMLPAKTSLSDIRVGDYVGVMGTVSEDGPTITATVVRDWTAKGAMMHDSMMKKDTMTGDHMMSSSTGSMMMH